VNHQKEMKINLQVGLGGSFMTAAIPWSLYHLKGFSVCRGIAFLYLGLL
jgi:hypothetical protein